VEREDGYIGVMCMKADIVVIGGGIVGVLIAHELARRGEDVLIVEKRYLGSGSTFRCGTGIRQQFTDEANVRMMKRAVELRKKYHEAYGFPFKQSGYLFLWYTEEEVEYIKKAVKLQNSLGVPTRLISPDEAKEIVPLLDVSEVIAATRNPTDAKASPFYALASFAKAAREMGARIMEYTEVIGIKRKGSSIDKVITTRGEISTGIVVNATNARAKLINAMAGVPIEIPIEPYKHQSVITQPIKGGTINPMVISLRYHHAYLTQTAHGGVIGGVGVEEGPTYDLTPTYEFLRAVSEAFTKIIPALRNLRILRIRAGFYAKTPDSNPAIGRIKEIDEFYIAAGFSGHGFMMAPSVAEAVADIITKGSTSLPIDRYDPYRFERGELRSKALQMGRNSFY